MSDALAPSSNPSGPSGLGFWGWSDRVVSILVLTVMAFVAFRFCHWLPAQPTSSTRFLDSVVTKVQIDINPYVQTHVSEVIAHFNEVKPQNCPEVPQPTGVENQAKALAALSTSIRGIISDDPDIQKALARHGSSNEITTRAYYLACGLVGDPNMPPHMLLSLTPQQQREFQLAVAPVTPTQNISHQLTVSLGNSLNLKVPETYTFVGHTGYRHGVYELGYLTKAKDISVITIGQMVGSASLEMTGQALLRLIQEDFSKQGITVKADGPHSLEGGGVEGVKFIVASAQSGSDESDSTIYYVLKDAGRTYVVLQSHLILPAQNGDLNDIRTVISNISPRSVKKETAK